MFTTALSSLAEDNSEILQEKPENQVQVYVPQNIRKIYFLHKISRTRF